MQIGAPGVSTCTPRVVADAHGVTLAHALCQGDSRGKKRRAHTYTRSIKGAVGKMPRRAPSSLSKKRSENTPPGRPGRSIGESALDSISLQRSSERHTHNITTHAHTHGHSPKKFLFWLRQIKMNTSS